jgi:glutamate--cysteine ligase catalytic subunit
MERAQKRDAARRGKFYFRKSVFPEGFQRPGGLPTPPPETTDGEEVPIPIRVHKGDCGRCYTHPAFLKPLEEVGSIEAEYEEMTLNEIINGKVRSCCDDLRLG